MKHKIKTSKNHENNAQSILARMKHKHANLDGLINKDKTSMVADSSPD